jgi:hypothetical protein
VQTQRESLQAGQEERGGRRGENGGVQRRFDPHSEGHSQIANVLAEANRAVAAALAQSEGVDRSY